MLRIGTWNTQWTSPRTVRGKVVSASLADSDCDILCVTEGYSDILPRVNYTIDGGRDCGYPIKKGRRKVILWSKRRWTNVVHFDSERPLGGRFVAGTTETDSGPLEGGRRLHSLAQRPRKEMAKGTASNGRNICIG